MGMSQSEFVDTLVFYSESDSHLSRYFALFQERQPVLMEELKAKLTTLNKNLNTLQERQSTGRFSADPVDNAVHFG